MGKGKDKASGNHLPPVSMSTAAMDWNRTGDWTFFAPVYADRTAPCSVSCPLSVPVNRYMHLVREGRWREAWEIIVAANPLPAVTGRVCYHDCESGCNRKEFDEALNIHSIERFIGDAAIDEAWPLARPAGKIDGPPVAVVGSGPAGLGCAYALRSRGYPVVVYERESAPGGMLRLGVPEFRMPRRLLDAELARLENIGVEFRCGRDVSDFEKISGSSRAVFLATGAHGARDPGVEGAHLEGVHFGLDFLKKYNSGRPASPGKRLAVIGGGNTSLDVARAGLRLGARVEVYYRRTESEMPAHPEELDEARGEGVGFSFQVAPLALLSAGSGRVGGVRLVRMRQGAPDDSGRARPVPVEGSEFEVTAEAVVFAIGERPELDYLAGRGERSAGRLAIDPFFRTSLTGVFAGGDLVPGDNSVSHALADGIAAGRNMHRLFQSFDPGGALAADGRPVAADDLNFDYFRRAPRVNPVSHLREKPRDNAETSATLAESQAREEASRCFNCGTCVDCDTCLVFCPDLAIYCREGDYLVRTEYCKGCGICAEECPRGVISMEKKK